MESFPSAFFFVATAADALPSKAMWGRKGGAQKVLLFFVLSKPHVYTDGIRYWKLGKFVCGGKQHNWGRKERERWQERQPRRKILSFLFQSARWVFMLPLLLLLFLLPLNGMLWIPTFVLNIKGQLTKIIKWIGIPYVANLNSPYTSI